MVAVTIALLSFVLIDLIHTTTTPGVHHWLESMRTTGRRPLLLPAPTLRQRSQGDAARERMYTHAPAQPLTHTESLHHHTRHYRPTQVVDDSSTVQIAAGRSPGHLFAWL